jgi:cold shock CspA family protein
MGHASHPEGWQCGSIVSYNPSKGFGFVRPDGSTDDVWFRREFTSLADDELRPGQRVEFLTADVNDKTRISAMRLVT